MQDLEQLVPLLGGVVMTLAALYTIGSAPAPLPPPPPPPSSAASSSADAPASPPPKGKSKSKAEAEAEGHSPPSWAATQPLSPAPASRPSWMASNELDHDERPSWMASAAAPATPSRHHVTAPNAEPHTSSLVQTALQFEECPSWMSTQALAPPAFEPSWRASTSALQQHHPGAPFEDAAHARAPTHGQDEEDDTPSWLSKDHGVPSFLHTSVAEARPGNAFQPKPGAPTPIHPPASAAKHLSGSSSHITFQSVNSIVSTVALHESAFVFVYPGGCVKDFLGESLVRRNHANVFEMETRVGCGSVAVGAGAQVKDSAQATPTVAILTSSWSLRSMTTSLAEMAARKLSVVVHVASMYVDEITSSARVGYDDVLTMRSVPNVIMLATRDAREAHMCAQLAHRLALACQGPVVHFFDGARVNNIVTDVAHEQSLVKVPPQRDHHHPHNMEKHAIHVLRTHGVAPFEYVGHPAPDVVFVALGSACTALEVVIASLPVTSRRVGLISVRLLRPWSTEQFLHVLPKTAVRVCVLDQGERARALYADVAVAMTSFVANGHGMPNLVAGHFPPSVRGFCPDAAHHLIEQLFSNDHFEDVIVHAPGSMVAGAVARSGMGGGLLGPTPLRSFSSLGGGEAGSSARPRSVAIWVTGPRRGPMVKAAHMVCEALVANEHGVHLAVSHDDMAFPDQEGATLIEIRFGKAAHLFLHALEAGDADVVACDAGALKLPGVDVLGPIAHGGEMLLLQKEAELTPSQKRRTTLQSCKVRRVDPHHVPEDENAQALVWLWSILELTSRQLCKTALPGVHRALHVHYHDDVAHNIAARLHNVASHLSMYTGSSLNPATAAVVPASAAGAAGSSVDLEHHFSLHAPRSSGSAGSGGGETASAVQDTVFGFVPRVFGHGMPVSVAPHDNSTDVKVVPAHEVAWNILFKQAYRTDAALRPGEHNTFQVVLTLRKRLTPLEYDRNIFHLEFDISGTELKYEIGDALGVFGHNDSREVDAFVEKYNQTGGEIDPDAFVAWADPKRNGPGVVELVSVRNLLQQHLDIFGRPNKKFYVWLSKYAKSRYEQLKLSHCGTDDQEAFKLGTAESLTFADILLQHPSARPPMEELARVIPPIKARHYSIASSMKFTPGSVHLLVVAVEWETPSKRKRYGQCTRYLANLEPGSLVTVDVQPSVLRLPPSPSQPIVMSGLGTGMAPFRAFIQERKIQKESGIEVGPVILYFGARHRHEEYLYGEEWDQYYKEGLVTKLGLAFSRDQKEKVYIQHKIKEDGPLLRTLFLEKGGFFYLCGPTWPVPDVRDALAAGLDPAKFQLGDTSVVEQLKDEGRYILEVY